MPFFRYSATDKTGAQSMGTIEAPTAEDATLKLLGDGLSVNQIMKAPDAGAPSVRAQQKPQPPTAKSVSPKQQPINAPKQARTVSPAPSRPGAAIQTKKAAPQAPTPKAMRVQAGKSSDRDRMLLFSQLSKQIKAGIGPAAALDDLQSRMPIHMQQSLKDASDAATNGQSISDAFEKYPSLYPETTVGMIRAAERGGFLEEATNLLGDQAQNAYSFNRSYWWVWPVILNGIIAIPIALLVLRGVTMSWDIVIAEGETATAGSTVHAMWTGVLRNLVWPVGPITLFFWALIFFGYRYFRSPKMQMKRHELALMWPVFGPRTRHECLSVFSWVMSKLSNSGISPKQSWDLAADAVPNIAVRDKLRRVGEALSGNEKLSDAIFKEQLFTQDYAPMIATAEMTGDVPKAFEQLAKLSQSEFQAAETDARNKSRSWGCALSMAFSGILLILLFYFWYRVLMPNIINGIEWLPI